MNAGSDPQGQSLCDTLVVAEFSDATTARHAYEALRGAEEGHRLRVDGALAVSADAEGEIHVEEMPDHDTSNGLKWGAVGGLILGVLFPPGLLASTIAWGAVGGLLGKLRNNHHKSELAAELEGALAAGKAGVVALIDGRARLIVEQSFVEASSITYIAVDDAAVAEITEAARGAG